MNRSDTLKNVIEIIFEETDISRDEIHEDSMLMRDLELSSLEVLSIVSRLEKKYGIRLDLRERQRITSVGDLVDWIMERGGSSASR